VDASPWGMEPDDSSVTPCDPGPTEQRRFGRCARTISKEYNEYN